MAPTLQNNEWMFYSEFNKNLFNSDYRIILYNLCLKDGQEKCNKNYLSLNTPFKIKIWFVVLKTYL